MDPKKTLEEQQAELFKEAGNPENLIYTVNEPPVVVKFARSYGEDVHRRLAAVGLAPELLGVDRLPGRVSRVGFTHWAFWLRGL